MIHERFVKHIGFRMTVGSGKTPVIATLIQPIRRLIHLAEIPPHDLLVHRAIVTLNLFAGTSQPLLIRSLRERRIL